MMNIKTIALLSVLLPAAAQANISIFACEPEWAALASEIGGQQVTTYSATTALQDPHYIQARPSLIARLRQADLVVCSGADLEIGWLPVLLQKANNPAVMPGSAGYLEASGVVERFDVSANVDRASGDIHPLGNPHVETNPHNIAAIASVLAERMQQLDVENAATYAAGIADFQLRWRAAIERWEAAATGLSGKRVVTHHKSWVYLERWLGLVEVANLEEVPGLPPTAGHLGRLVAQFENGGADVIVRAPYQDNRASEWLSDRTGIPAVVLPLTVGGTDEATDLFRLFDDIIARLLGATS